MSAVVPDFTDAEREAVDTLLRRRYGEPTPVDLADSELSREPGGDETTTCPTLHRDGDCVPFVVFDTGESADRCLIFCGDVDQ